MVWLRALVAYLLLAVTGPAMAETRALLFGVSEYPALPPEKALKAPANDVQRMRQALAARGLAPGAMTVLADGVDDAQALPTRAAILAALAQQAESAQPGDLVVIYGSGHGARQKSLSGLKLDGLDQLFLPRDGAVESNGTFRNAIVSTEFGLALDAIRRKGADVWFMLDSCFSGAASRSVLSDVHEKMIDPGDVGIAVATMLMPERQTMLAESPPLPAGSGRLVALYASQPNETAREVALPTHLPLARRNWGSIFTLALARVLQSGAPLTYRQAIVETGRLLRADPAFQARQTPSFEGDGLDEPVMRGAAAPVAALSVRDGQVQAGALDGIEEGAVLALYERLESLAAQPLAEAVVTKTTALTADLALRAGATAATLKKAAYARLIRPAPGATLRLTALRPHPTAPMSAEELARAAVALDRAMADAGAGRVTRDDAAPELALWATAAGLRLSPAATDAAASEIGPLVTTGSIEQDGQAVLRAILRARQVMRLQKLAETSLGGRDLTVTVAARRFGPQQGTRACAFAPGGGALLAATEAVTTCDRIAVTVENSGRRTLYPAVFFLDDGWNILPRRPSCPVGLTVADRLEPGRTLTFDVPYRPEAIRPGLAPATANGVLVIAVPFEEGQIGLPNLCGLAAFNDRKPGATRAGGEGDDLDDLLQGTTRSGARVRLDTSSVSLTFWPVAQPLR